MARLKMNHASIELNDGQRKTFPTSVFQKDCNPIGIAGHEWLGHSQRRTSSARHVKIGLRFSTV
jgi:hypothetical protein